MLLLAHTCDFVSVCVRACVCVCVCVCARVACVHVVSMRVRVGRWYWMGD